MGQYGGETLQNLLSIGQTLSFAIPDGSAFFGAAIQAAQLFLPEEHQVSVFQEYVTGLSKQFSDDQEEATQLMLYFVGLSRALKNGEWSNIYEQYQKYVAPSDSTDSVQVQEGLLYQDILPDPRRAVDGSRGEFNGKQDIWPVWFSIASSRLTLASFAPMAEFKTNANSTFTDISQASSIPTVVNLAGSRFGAAVAYCNLSALDRFRRVYYATNGTAPANFPWVYDDGTGESKENPEGGPDEWVAKRWAQIADEAMGVFSTTADSGKNWQSALKWYALYSSWVGKLGSDSARPLAAPPAPLTQLGWYYSDASQLKRFNDDFWGPQRLLVYYHTLVDADGAESPAGPVLVIPTVDANNGYGCVLDVPPDATGLASERRIYKTVFSPKMHDDDKYAESELNAHLVGTVQGTAEATITDLNGLHEK